MQVDALALRLRPRTAIEAADLGVRLCQHSAREVFSCYLALAVPVALVASLTFMIKPWLPIFTLWMLKPWFDRTILYVLSRSAFAQPTQFRDLWRDQRQVWWQRLLFTLTLRRLSPWRSFTQPAYQLEGLSLWRSQKRVNQLRRGRAGSAALMTGAYSLAEICLVSSLMSLLFWLGPQQDEWDPSTFFTEQSAIQMLLYVAYSATLLFLEPFYVASGFAMYLNRRAELEAWDLEQDFKRVLHASD